MNLFAHPLWFVFILWVNFSSSFLNMLFTVAWVLGVVGGWAAHEWLFYQPPFFI